MTNKQYILPPSALTDLLSDWESHIPLIFDWAKLPEMLDNACRYAMVGGGKRIRPRLCLGSFLTVARTFDGRRVHEQMALRSALAVELLHGYSLVHDDLPCMDNDMLRRGQPTCHIAFGEGVALLVGDVLQSLAFEVLGAELPQFELPDKALVGQLTAMFANASRRMVAGQFLDTMGEGKTLTQEALQAIHRDKTGALIEASVLMGGLCAGASDDVMAWLLGFSSHLGLAFQVQDDVLDVIGDTQTLGKSVGSDEKLDKSTYVKLLGVQGANEYAQQLFEQALVFATKIDDNPNNLLCQLTNQVVHRNR